MSPSLATLARELNAELTGAHPDPDRRSSEISKALRLQRPDTTTKGRQRAAAAAVGVGAPPSGAQAAALQDEPGRAGRAARRGKKAAKRGSRRAKKAARRVRTSSVGSLVTQALGLTALYWVLRYPDSVTRVTDGLARGFAWLAAPIPFGGVSETNPSAGTEGSPISDPQPR